MEPVTKTLCITLGGLFVVSWGYNALLAWLERKGYHDGYVSLFVVGGVAYTLLTGVWLIGLEPTLILLAAFAASGLPMVLGSIWRYVGQRTCEERRLREQARQINGES